MFISNYIYFLIAIVFFIYSIFETISLEFKYVGHKVNFYPLGVSYSNIALSICRLLILFFMLFIAFILDNHALKNIPVNFFIISLLIPSSFLLGLIAYYFVRFKIFLILARFIHANKFTAKKSLKSEDLRTILLSTNRKNNTSFSFKITLTFMFFFAYLGIPICIYYASVFDEYRTTITQLIAIFSGVYAFLNTIFIDPLLSKHFRSSSYPELYETLFQIRFATAVIIPLILVMILNLYG